MSQIMIKTHPKSIFTRFHNNSQFANEVFSSHYPSINSKPIDVLQVKFLDNNLNYNVLIEFMYKDIEKTGKAKMTILEYEKKLQMIRTSDASYEIKRKAIQDLERKFNTKSSQEIAIKQMIESAPDTDDIGDN